MRVAVLLGLPRAAAVGSATGRAYRAGVSTLSAVLLRLPDPMLARSGTIPSGRGWTFEPKLDGFRCLVCTHAGFRARSRRGWNMTAPLPEFADTLPTEVQLDGELVALG